MRFRTEILKLNTKKELEFIDITEKIKIIVKKSKIREGFVTLFSKHTTLMIKINEWEKLLLGDMKWLMKKIAPPWKSYAHDKIKLRKNCLPDEPKNAKGHLRSMMLETSQLIPILKNQMQLGKFQKIFAIETSGPREREIIVQTFG